MSDNRYRRGSPPGSRRYHDPRTSTGTVFSSSFDPNYSSHSRGSLEPYTQTRHGSLYDTQPVKKYSYQDGSHGPTMSRTEYAVRPRNDSGLPSESRRPLSMIVKNTSPTRSRPVVSNLSRDDPRKPVVGHQTSREDASRYLVPASSLGREHHQRHYSATRADTDSLNAASRSIRPRGEYHQSGGYSEKAYPVSRIKDDDFSYTGPREQFARDYPSRPPQRRENAPQRERPASVYDPGDYKNAANARRDLGPPPVASRQLDKLERTDGSRVGIRSGHESDPERGSDLPRRRHSMRAPVVHQIREDDYREYPSRDERDLRPPPRPRSERIDEEEPLPRPRRERIDDEPLPRPRRERAENEEPLQRPRRERIEEDEPLRRARRERIEEDEPLTRFRKDPVELDDAPLKARQRERERDRDQPKENDRERDRERERERLRPAERGPKHSDDRREVRSRETSPDHSGVGKGVAASLGSIAAVGLAGAALKGSQKPEEASDSDSRKERKHRKHKHRDRDSEIVDPREPEQYQDRKAAPAIELDDREERRHGSRRDESASESMEDDTDKRRHHRRKHRDRDAPDVDAAAAAAAATTAGDTRLAPDPQEAERETLQADDETRRRRRHSRVREPDPAELERRKISPGEEEDGRPRRVQLVEPVKDKDEVKPRGILKAPRTIPFPEDPNPTREGVAPLKDAGKDGVPPGARWTKISRALVNPEALQKAQERFEERDDYVIVLRVISREEIQKLAEKTRELRDTRQREWQAELERRRSEGGDNQHRPPHLRDDANEENHARPLLDQAPANPSYDLRALVNPEFAANPPVEAMAVPDIRFENVEAPNYSTNV